MSDKDLKYKNKYLKYKNKYLNLKNYTGGNNVTDFLPALVLNFFIKDTTLNYDRIDNTKLLQIAELMKINKTVTTLNITNTTFSDSDKGFNALCDALKTNTTLQILNLTTSSLTDNQANEIIKLLKINKTFLEIIIDDNIVYYNYYKDYKKIITDQLKLNFINTINNKTLEEITIFLNKYTTLDITDTTISDIGFENLCIALKENTTLETLDIGNNNNLVDIDLMIDTLFNALKQNKTLKKLHLNINKLNDNDAKRIKELLKFNTTLNTLKFSSNQFTNKGKNYFNELQKKNDNYILIIYN